MAMQPSAGGSRVMRWCKIVLLNWIFVGQGPTALAVGAGGFFSKMFLSPLSFLSSFFLSLGGGPINT